MSAAVVCETVQVSHQVYEALVALAFAALQPCLCSRPSAAVLQPPLLSAAAAAGTVMLDPHVQDQQDEFKRRVVVSLVQAKRRQEKCRLERVPIEDLKHCHWVLFKDWEQDHADIQHLLAMASKAPGLDSIIQVIQKGAVMEKKMNDYMRALRKVAASQKPSNSNL